MVMQLARLGRPVLQRDDVAADLPLENRRRRVDVVVSIKIIALCSVTSCRTLLVGTAPPARGPRWST
jgi:hypothetical protein